MYDIGRLCLKIAGRDAGSYCLIVDKQEDKFLVDGQTRRRAVNPAHLEPLDKQADIKKGADHKAVVKALEGFGIEVIEPVKQKDAVSKKTKKQ